MPFVLGRNDIFNGHFAADFRADFFNLYSGGRSLLNAGVFQFRRRLANGISADSTYTVMRSMDDVPSLGAGGGVVAQNPQDLGAEWALSNFDKRNQLVSDLGFELPAPARKLFVH